MKMMNLLENIASAMKWLGVLAASLNHQDSKLVAMCLSMAAIGLVAEKVLRVLVNSKINALNNARCREWSYLNVIRLRNSEGDTVDTALLEQSKTVSKEVDELYKKIYGFYRPVMAVKASK